VSKRVAGYALLAGFVYLGLRFAAPRPEVLVSYHAGPGALRVVLRDLDRNEVARVWFAEGAPRVHAPPIGVGRWTAELTLPSGQRTVDVEVPGSGQVEVYWTD